MATPTFDLISSTTISSPVTTITVSSIPQTYKDLVVVIEGNSSTSIGGIAVYFNNYTGFDYDVSTLEANGSSRTSTNNQNANRAYTSFNYNFWGTTPRMNLIAQFNNYSSTSQYKSMISRANNPNNAVNLITNILKQTTAISSLRFDASNFATNTTIKVFGIVG